MTTKSRLTFVAVSFLYYFYFLLQSSHFSLYFYCYIFFRLFLLYFVIFLLKSVANVLMFNEMCYICLNSNDILLSVALKCSSKQETTIIKRQIGEINSEYMVLWPIYVEIIAFYVNLLSNTFFSYFFLASVLFSWLFVVSTSNISM